MSELKPCPWPHCGSEQATVYHLDHGWRCVWCEECDARGPARETEAEAIAAWNDRDGGTDRLEVAALLGRLIETYGDLPMSVRRLLDLARTDRPLPDPVAELRKELELAQ